MTAVPACNTSYDTGATFFAREYPLIKIFKYGEEILVYDAKPHFAFILASDEINVLIEFLSDKSPNEIISNYIGPLNKLQLHNLLEKFQALIAAGVFCKGPVAEISPVDPTAIEEQLKYFDENILLRKFCLEVTQNCNFSCRYCRRTIAAKQGQASQLNMSEDTAYKGIRYYFKRYTDFFAKLAPEKKKSLLEIVPPTLSWYGGEPFLNFEVIKKSASYFKSLPWEQFGIPTSGLKFTANTNLSIINDEILKFLIDNNITLFVSLDGPQEEHDKCRVFENGTGTFNLAYNNLMKIKAFNNSYFMKKVTIFGVFTAEHDYAKCVDFTGKLGASLCQHFSVDYDGTFIFDIAAETAYYEEALANDLAAYTKMVLTAENKNDADINNFANIFQFAKLNTDHPLGKNSLNIMLTCPMGFDNLMLAANGDFLICHKASGTMPIGNCDAGLSSDNLIDFNQEYNSAINNPNCKSCWNVNFCTICAAARLNGNNFINPSQEECDCFRLRTAYDFSCFLSLAQNQPNLLKRIFDYRNNRKNFIGIIDINEF